MTNGLMAALWFVAAINFMTMVLGFIERFLAKKSRRMDEEIAAVNDSECIHEFAILRRGSPPCGADVFYCVRCLEIRKLHEAVDGLKAERVNTL